MLVVLGQVVEGHDRDHGRVAQRLQFQVAAVVGAFEFDDHQPAVAVHAQQVDPAPGVGERAELLRHDQHTVDDRVDPGAEQSLQVGTLQDLRGGKARRRNLDQRLGRHLEQRHGKYLA
ncbi:hypothetical protein AB0K00_25390 [Dactylosporangium sp. NPDC049525]|uniref:hypothetical protein n=1 Tax=Dactylosporangium sp. NPDC049525 TaxID=3154730 RepID=UPI003417BB98